jgi:hypothetical protein
MDTSCAFNAGDAEWELGVGFTTWLDVHLCLTIFLISSPLFAIPCPYPPDVMAM